MTLSCWSYRNLVADAEAALNVYWEEVMAHEEEVCLRSNRKWGHTRRHIYTSSA